MTGSLDITEFYFLVTSLTSLFKEKHPKDFFGSFCQFKFKETSSGTIEFLYFSTSFFLPQEDQKENIQKFPSKFFFLNIFSLKSPINLNYCNVGSRQSRDRMPQITHVSISQLQGARIFSRVEKERKKKNTDKLRID